jgi:hypothetical protein
MRAHSNFQDLRSKSLDPAGTSGRATSTVTPLRLGGLCHLCVLRFDFVLPLRLGVSAVNIDCAKAYCKIADAAGDVPSALVSVTLTENTDDALPLTLNGWVSVNWLP